jgi:hypothetical protein
MRPKDIRRAGGLFSPTAAARPIDWVVARNVALGAGAN